MPPADRKNPKRAKASESTYSLVEFMRDFPDDATCLNWLWNTRYATNDAGTEAHCSRCECLREFKRYDTTQQRQSWTCTACGLHIHPTAGTIFHKSSTSLHLWFYAMYLMTSTRCGISAKQLERELGVTYKTAWRMFTLIRNELMGQDAQPLSGAVEMDEMYVGGKPRQSDRNKWRDMTPAERNRAAKDFSVQKRTPVFGMVERSGGEVRAVVVENSQADTLLPHVIDNVKRGSTIYTDDGTMYRRMNKLGYEHHTVNHRAKVYVSGDIHTQQIEGFWSLVKRGISGTHHHVSAKYLQGYLNEYAWRYNRRGVDGDGNRRLMFLELALRAALG